MSYADWGQFMGVQTIQVRYRKGPLSHMQNSMRKLKLTLTLTWP